MTAKKPRGRPVGRPIPNDSLPIISSRKDVCSESDNMGNFHPLKLRDNILVTGYELRGPALVQTPIGSSRAEKLDWVIILPDGNIWRFPKKLFALMFETELRMDMVGTPCIRCGHPYGKVGGEVRCIKCGEWCP